MTTTEQRVVTVPGEVRTDPSGRRLVGHAAIYDTPSRDLGGFTERIAPGAFDHVLAGGPDVTLNVNHDDSQVLARTSSGTLRLRSDARGLAFEADLGDGPLAAQVRDSVRRGDMTGASFRFRVDPGGDTWDDSQRTVTRVAELLDVCVATRPAYDAPRVEVRTHEATKEAHQMSTTEAHEADATTPTEAPDTPPEAPTEARTESAGGLRVEDRTGHAGPSVEKRLMDEMLAVRPGEARALTLASVLAPGELSTHLFDKLRARSVALASGIRVITTDRDTVTFPRLTADVSPSWTAEAATITPGDPALDTITATPRKLAHLARFSNEILEDSAPDALTVVRDNLVAAMALRLDLGIFEGSGTAPEIRGLKNTPGIQTVSMGANGGQLASLDAVLDAVRLLADANATAGAIVCGPRTWRTLAGLKDGQNRYQLAATPTSGAPYSVFGIRVHVTPQLSVTEAQGTASNAASIYVYDPAHVVLVRRTDVTLELDRSRLFDSDESELRGRMRADLLVPNPAAVVRISGVLP